MWPKIFNLEILQAPSELLLPSPKKSARKVGLVRTVIRNSRNVKMKKS